MIDYRKSHSCFKTFFTDPKNLPGILCIIIKVLLYSTDDGVNGSNNNNSSTITTYVIVIH